MLLLKALLVLGTATAVFARGRIDAIVSGACMNGQDTTSRDSHGEEIFRDPRNHPSAVASLLRYSADRADFRPREKGVITDPKVYEHFMKDVCNFPGFQVHHQQNQRLELQGDREQFKREIAKKYKSDRVDPWAMARAFEHLIPQELDEDNQEWLLNYVVLNTQDREGHQGNIEVEIASVMLQLTKGSNDETKIKRQTAEMTMNAFNVKRQYLVEHASSLAQRVRTMRARKALKELSSTGQLGGGDEDEEEDNLDLEAWFQGLLAPEYRAYPVSRWNVQY